VDNDMIDLFTSEQRALLDEVIKANPPITAIITDESQRVLADVLSEYLQLPTLTQPPNERDSHIFVLASYRYLGPGLYLVADQQHLLGQVRVLSGPSGSLFQSPHPPYLELALEDGTRWLCGLAADGEQPRTDVRAAISLREKIPSAVSIALVGDDRLWGVRLERVELAADSLVIFSWRARENLEISSCDGIEVGNAAGDGLGQCFRFVAPHATMTLAISSDIVAAADTLSITYELLDQAIDSPTRWPLIHRGLGAKTLAKLEASLRDEPERARGFDIEHANQLKRSAATLAESGSRLARLGSLGLHQIGERIATHLAPTSPTQYDEWLAHYDHYGKTEVLGYLAEAADVPTLSIVIPIFDPDLVYLQAAINSVVEQRWPTAELILSLDGPQPVDVMDYLDHLTHTIPYLKIVTSAQRHNIAIATQSGIDVATGDFLCFMDQDDTLAPDALAWVAAYLHALPDTELLYTDEDKIDDHKRCEPFFKPDFSPEYLLCVNYINHLSVLRRETCNRAGGLVAGTEGAQDWDLLLRVTSMIAREQVVHIPKVLYHWRSHAGSTAQSYAAKPQVIAAQERAVSSHLARQDYSVAWLERPRSAPIFLLPHLRPTRSHRISIIIPTKDHLKDLRTCLDSVMASYYGDIEVVVIDNNSTEPEVLDYLDGVSDPIRVIHYRAPFNFAAMVNYGVANATGDLVVLLNNDTRVISPNWLAEMAALAERPDIGAVGAKLLYPDGSVQHNGVCLGIAGSAGHYGWSKDHSDPGDHGRGVVLTNSAAVTGAALMVERDKYLEVGGLHPELAISFNDVDLCLALGAAGYRSVVVPSAMLYHYESKSRGYNVTRSQHYREDLESSLFYRRWASLIPNDPYYSPNLSRELLHMFEPDEEPPRLRLPFGEREEIFEYPSPHVSAHESWYELAPDHQLQILIPLTEDQLQRATYLSLTAVSPNSASPNCKVELMGPDPQGNPVTTSFINDVITFDLTPYRDLRPPLCLRLTNKGARPLLLGCLDLPSGMAALGSANVVVRLSYAHVRSATGSHRSVAEHITD
jgi:GT2 family glycosyltransferase